MGPLHPQNPYGAMSRRAKAFDYDRYGLSTEQRRRIASIRERYDRVIRRIDDDDRNRAAKIARLERKEREEIADVLNSEQRRRFLRELDRD
jgi:K+/H+ antiporter YhaU regulatory subunit KhtT